MRNANLLALLSPRIAGAPNSTVKATYEVDIKDDLQVSGQEVLKHGDGPLLHGLGENGVVGEGKGLGDDLPGIIPVQHFLIDQQTLELDNSQRRVSIYLGYCITS